MKRFYIGTALSALIISNGLALADELKIGLLSTLSGPGAALGNEIKDGFELALSVSNNKLGGVPVKLIIADDQQKASEGRQAADRLIKRDKVDLLTGMVFSNVLLPVMPLVLNSGKIYISTNTGPMEYAGNRCHKNFLQYHGRMRIFLQQWVSILMIKNIKVCF